MRRRDALTLGLTTAVLAPLAAAGSAHAGGPSGGGSAPPSYTRLNTITASVRRGDGRMGVMTVEAGVDCPPEALRARAAQSAPRLTAAYSEVLRRFAPSVRPGFPPDVERLSRELQAATDRTLGRSGARLLLGTVMIA
ncbi:Tat pathway signal protein [Brevundimonas sp. 2R-24]|uniref:Tat pathway signal protein n=1 Tax=Peiella sedimenti TaxID=3061083 RepID=A0ABT8SKE4_9CAUL|nr:Tat pathway signal protein [Caulobacteraceae bacterium XZ-24]